ncbi:MAG: HAD-IB family phosphatase [Alphaproteobacteria bacterium]|nr:HAD-IB family phosphatase [Alphaproteobacteria bacterium]
MFKRVNVVLFDFDGTLSWPDSNTAFLHYCMRHSIKPWLFLPLIVFCACVGILRPGGIWWRQNMRRFITKDMVRKFAPDFIKQHIRNRFGWAAEKVADEQAAGNKVLLISASPDYLIPKLVHDMKFDAVICSKMYTKKPWKYRFLCRGYNKVYAMDEWAKENNFIPHVVRAYSDSKTDMPMMEIAEQQIWINPKTGLPVY